MVRVRQSQTAPHAALWARQRAVGGDRPRRMTAPRATASSNQTAEKIEAARRSLDFVAAGMVVGLGSGSTAAEMVRLLGERVRAGLAIRGIPSSTATRQLALGAGIPLIDFSSVGAIDVTIDGADEVDPQGGMIKGRG